VAQLFYSNPQLLRPFLNILTVLSRFLYCSLSACSLQSLNFYFTTVSKFSLPRSNRFLYYSLWVAFYAAFSCLSFLLESPSYCHSSRSLRSERDVGHRSRKSQCAEQTITATLSQLPRPPPSLTIARFRPGLRLNHRLRGGRVVASAEFRRPLRHCDVRRLPHAGEDRRGGSGQPHADARRAQSSVLVFDFLQLHERRVCEGVSATKIGSEVSMACCCPRQGVPKWGKGSTIPGLPNHWLGGPRSPSEVASAFFSTVHLLPKDLRFEHEVTRLASCLGRRLTLIPPPDLDTPLASAKKRCCNLSTVSVL